MQSFHIETIDSTSEHAKRLIAAGEITGDAYVLAREQTHGKGSRGRHWVSPRDAGLYLSLVRRLDPPIDSTSIDVADLTLAAAIGCVEALRESIGLEARIKPINDLYVQGRKLGGILTEAVIERGRIQTLVTGIGINTRRAQRNISNPVKGETPGQAERKIPLPTPGRRSAVREGGRGDVAERSNAAATPISIEEAQNRGLADEDVAALRDAVIRLARRWLARALAGSSAAIRDALDRYGVV